MAFSPSKAGASARQPVSSCGFAAFCLCPIFVRIQIFIYMNVRPWATKL